MEAANAAALPEAEKIESVKIEADKTKGVKDKQETLEDVQLPEHLDDVQLIPEKIEDVKEEGPSFACELYDTELVHKIAQELLTGLATACVDNTTGGLFKTPATVAVEIRREMIQYLTQRSESFVAESVILEGGQEGEVSDHPFDIISAFLDDFDSMKRNWFSRVSGWLLSEMREDRVDDFVQEMEQNSFWVLDRRATVAQTLLKNVDFKNIYHCNQKFGSEEELAGHGAQCGFRSVMCENEGCNATFSAAHMEKHDSQCPFKVLPCELKCPEYLLRREMDRHCITVCPMKLVNCPFYSIGCQTPVPQSMTSEHCLETVHSHLLYALQFIHKEASMKCLKERVEQIEQSPYCSGLGGVKVVKFFNIAVKDIEKKLGPFDYKTKEEEESEEEKKNEDAMGENGEEDTKKEETKDTESEKESTKEEEIKDREMNVENSEKDNMKGIEMVKEAIKEGDGKCKDMEKETTKEDDAKDKVMEKEASKEEVDAKDKEMEKGNTEKEASKEEDADGKDKEMEKEATKEKDTEVDGMKKQGSKEEVTEDDMKNDGKKVENTEIDDRKNEGSKEEDTTTDGDSKN